MCNEEVPEVIKYYNKFVPQRAIRINAIVTHRLEPFKASVYVNVFKPNTNKQDRHKFPSYLPLYTLCVSRAVHKYRSFIYSLSMVWTYRSTPLFQKGSVLSVSFSVFTLEWNLHVRVGTQA